MVKKGYKETEIGVIPEDWEINTLEPTIGKVKSGKRLPKGYLVTQNITPHPYIRVIDMKMGMLDTANIMYVPDEAFPPISQYRIYKDDLYISVAGTLGLVGRIPEFLDGANLTENANRITDISCDVNYLLYWLMGSEIQKRISDSQTLGAQPKLALYQIRNFPIPTPRLEEQQKIAEVLSDMDNLISSFEKLIEKKKAIKQGAMQELLTGKKRLYGFNGEWTKMNLAKKSKIKARIGWQGLTTAEYLDSGYSYLVTGTDFNNGFIDWGGCHYVEKNRFDQDKNIQIQNDDILITKDGSLGKVAYVSGLSKPATLNSGVFVIRPIQNAYDTRFVYYVLSSFVFKEFLEQLSAGSTIIHLYQKDMNKFEFYIPDDIKEQKAIADILFDMDAEITVLEQKLVKCQKLKQGMMQQLLTGKIRLI